MKAYAIKDKKLRLKVKKHEIKRLFLKGITKNQSLTDSSRWIAQIQLDRLSKNRSRTRLRNRCILTNRRGGIESNLKISRMKFRDLASFGLVPGIKKAVW